MNKLAEELPYAPSTGKPELRKKWHEELWGNYNMIFGIRHSANIKRYKFFSEKNGFNIEDFRDTVFANTGKGKIMVLLNFPNNPTGYSITESECIAIRDVLVEASVKGCNIIAICDDAYFGLFFEDDVCKESVFGHLAGRHNRLLAVKLDGVKKNINCVLNYR